MAHIETEELNIDGWIDLLSNAEKINKFIEIFKELPAENFNNLYENVIMKKLKICCGDEYMTWQTEKGGCPATLAAVKELPKDIYIVPEIPVKWIKVFDQMCDTSQHWYVYLLKYATEEIIIEAIKRVKEENDIQQN